MIGEYERDLLAALTHKYFYSIIEIKQFKSISCMILMVYMKELVDNFKRFKESEESDQKQIETYYRELKKDIKQIRILYNYLM